METAPSLTTEEYAKVEFLLGSLDLKPKGADSPETLVQPEEWQAPYYNVALQGLKRIIGQETIPKAWIPSEEQAVEVAELHRELTPARKRLRMVQGLDSYIRQYEEDGATSELRDHQKTVFGKTLKYLKNIEGPGRIKMPTGTGKTAIFSLLIHTLKHNEAPHEPVKSLVLVPTKDILLQTVGARGEKGFGRFAPDLDIGVYYGDEQKDLKDVTVMTYASFRNAMRDGIIDEKTFDVLIVDEAHEAIRGKIGQYVKRCSKQMVTIGLSATTHGAEVLFSQNIHSMDLVEAIDDDLLVGVDCDAIETEYEIKEEEGYASRADFKPSELQHLAEEEARNQLIVTETLKKVNKGLPTLVRCLPGNDMAHAKEIARRLNEKGVPTQCITGKMSPYARQKAYAKLSSGELKALTFYGVITRGFDCPEAKGLVDSVDCGDIKLKEQILGRILRYLEDENGNPIRAEATDIVSRSKKRIYTFADVLRRRPSDNDEYYAHFRRFEQLDLFQEELHSLSDELGLDLKEDYDLLADILYGRWMKMRAERGFGGEYGDEAKETQTPVRPDTTDLVDEVRGKVVDTESQGSVSFSLHEVALGLGISLATLERLGEAFPSLRPKVGRGARRKRYMTQNQIEDLAARLLERDEPVE